MTLHLDLVTTTLALISLHDPSKPVWAVYFISIVSVAHMLTRPQMAEYVVWCGLNYLAVAAVTQALGHDAHWGYVVVVWLIIHFMGINATILAGGQQRFRDLLERVATTDSLTGIANRHHFHATYTSAIDDAITRRSPLAFMLVDVDHLRRSTTATAIPRAMTNCARSRPRSPASCAAADFVARYGGDEFSVVAPDTTRVNALSLAERLRDAAATVGASVSIGVAILPDDATREDTLIEAADRALYEAKAAGHNCVRPAAFGRLAPAPRTAAIR